MPGVPPAPPRVVVITLGGTIASAGAGGVAPVIAGEELVASVPSLAGLADLDLVDLRRVPSGDLTIDDLREVADRARAARESGVDGVVVVQGTDTIEESAFALDLLAGSVGPVVVTGAMRPPGAPGADGPANLGAAVRVAASDEARGLGAVVVMSDEIHAARWVRKTHASSPGAFTSPGRGPIGDVTEGEVRVWARPVEMVRLTPSALVGRVALVGATLGADGRELDSLGALGYTAAVIEAFGVGHVPSAMVEALDRLVSTMPVALATRAGAGRVHGRSYGFVGSESDLAQRGLLGSGALSAAKACVTLSLLQGADGERAEVERLFRHVVRLV